MSYRVNQVKNINGTSFSPDNVYIDIKVANNTESRGIIMEFEQTKAEPIIDNPSDYYLSVVRWKVPAFDFPLLIFPIQDNQANPNLSKYSVTLQTSTDEFQQFLYFTNRNSTRTPKVPLNAIPEQSNSAYYWIYEYQHMVDIINDAFTRAFANVTGKPIGSQAPILLFDPVSKLFSLVAQFVEYGCDILPTPSSPAQPTTQPTYDADIKIFFNFDLFTLFNGFPTKSFPAPTTNGKDVQLLVYQTGDNFFPVQNSANPFPTPLVEMLQNFPSIASWTPVKQLLFTTRLIPIQSEYTTTSNDSYKKILTDFEPNQDSNVDIRETLQYFPRGVYRLVDMTGTIPVYNIDLKVTWLDVKGNEYDAYVPIGSQFTAKLLFVKRSLYKENQIVYE